MNQQQQNLVAFIWNVADMLRGNFRQSEFGRSILPFTVLRRRACVLEPTLLATLMPTTITGQIGLQEAV